MGTWGHKPWDSDDAADWFAETFAKVDIDAAIAEACRYSDNYGAIRSACYLLTVLGRSAYMWPGDLERLNQHKRDGLELLRAMAAEGSDFRALWGDDATVLAELEGEIAALEAVTRAE